MKKWISRSIDGILGVFIAALVGCQIAMLISEKSNYGVPSLFGYSFMRVLTDSMTGTASDSFGTGSGIIIEKTDPSSIRTDEVITFYDDSAAFVASLGQAAPCSHRVMEIEQAPSFSDGVGYLTIPATQEYSDASDASWKMGTGLALPFEQGANVSIHVIGADYREIYSVTIPSYTAATSGALTFYTCGDNLKAQTCPSGGCSSAYRDIIPSAKLIGRVVAHSDTFGSFLGIVQSPWFVPIAVLLPLSVIAALTAVDLVKEAKKDNALEKEKLEKKMRAAGVDPSNEKAALLFEEKTRYQEEIAKEMAEARAREKKKAQKELRHKKGKEASH